MAGYLNVYSLPRLLILLLTSGLGLFVIAHNRKSYVCRSFCLLALSVCIWQCGHILLSHIKAPSMMAIFLAKISYCGVVFITPTMYHFIISFLHMDRIRNVKLFYIYAGLIALVISLGDFFIVGVKKYFWGYYPQIALWPHIVFIALWIIPCILSLIHLYAKYHEATSPFEKKRIQYFLFGFPFAFLGTVDFIPNHGIEIYPFGVFPVAAFILFTTYMIIRYRLFNIELVIKRVSLITLGFVLLVSVLYFGVLYLHAYLIGLWGENWIIFPIIVSFFVGLGAFSFVNFVRHMEEDELSRKFAYRPLLKREAQRLSRVRNINELISYVLRDLSSWMGLDYIGICLWDPAKKAFVLTRNLTRTKKRKKIVSGLLLAEGGPLIKYLLAEQAVLVASEMQYHLRAKAVSQDERERLSHILSQMQRLGAELVIPSFCEENLLAFLVIGNKLNVRDIVTHGDIDMLSSFANQLARTIHGFLLQEEKVQLVVASQKVLISAIEAKDRYTHGHTDRVAQYSVLIGQYFEKQLRAFANGLADLQWAALLHDVGKISIPDNILLKQGTLDDHEWEIIRQHPHNGIRIIGPVQEWLGEDICKGIVHHHENFDGTGYPHNQCGESIHLFARIIRVADSFDAITSDRPYRRALPFKNAIDELQRFSGTLYDPEVVEVMVRLYREGKLKDLQKSV